MMKKYVASVLVFTLAACGDSASDTPQTGGASVDEAAVQADGGSAAEAAAAPAPAPAAKMPFDLPLAPDSRILDGDFLKFERKGVRQSIGALASKKNPAEMVAFYKAALIEAGFEITSESDYGTTATVHAKRGGGDEFTITTARSGSGVEKGESQSGVTAKFAQ